MNPLAQHNWQSITRGRRGLGLNPLFQHNWQGITRGRRAGIEPFGPSQLAGHNQR